jgi:hypothetical protein
VLAEGGRTVTNAIGRRCADIAKPPARRRQLTLLAIADDSKRNPGQSPARRRDDLVDASSLRWRRGTTIATEAAMDCDSGHSFAAITREG